MTWMCVRGVLLSTIFLGAPFTALMAAPLHAGVQKPLSTETPKAFVTKQQPEKTLPSALQKNAAVDGGLSPEQIKNFVMAIAMIRHFYIRDIPDREMFEHAIRGLVEELDAHSMLLTKQEMQELQTNTTGELLGVGVEIVPMHGVIQVVAAIDGSPAAKAGVHAGDLILKIDGKLVRGLSMAEAIKLIRGTKGTSVNFVILRKEEKEPLKIAVKRDVVQIQPIKVKMFEGHYGYLRIAFFQSNLKTLMEAAILKLKQEAKDHALKGLVIDVRNDPGGVLTAAVEATELFLSEKDLKRFNGLVTYTSGRADTAKLKFTAHPHDLLLGVPLVILVNGGSASASEILAGALQDYKRALVMGTQTFGKGSVQTILPLTDDMAIKLTTALYHTPAGRTIQGKGITPDILIEPLKITGTEKSELEVNESNLMDALKNPSADILGTATAKTNAELDKLAKEDYQLYQGVVTLAALARQQF